MPTFGVDATPAAYWAPFQGASGTPTAWNSTPNSYNLTSGGSGTTLSYINLPNATYQALRVTYTTDSSRRYAFNQSIASWGSYPKPPNANTQFYLIRTNMIDTDGPVILFHYAGAGCLGGYGYMIQGSTVSSTLKTGPEVLCGSALTAFPGTSTADWHVVALSKPTTPGGTGTPYTPYDLQIYIDGVKTTVNITTLPTPSAGANTLQVCSADGTKNGKTIDLGCMLTYTGQLTDLEVATISTNIRAQFLLAPPSSVVYPSPLLGFGSFSSTWTPTSYSGDAPTTVDISSLALYGSFSANQTTGVITGTPSTITNVSPVIVWSNAAGSTNVTLSLRLYAQATITYLSAQTLVVSEAMSTLSPTLVPAADGFVSYSSFALTVAVPGLSCNGLTGAITGTPTTDGVYATAVTATLTGRGTVTSNTITFTVVPYPTVTYADWVITQYAGSSLTVWNPTVNFTPGPSGPLGVTYAVSPALPTGITLNTTTGSISVLPTASAVSQTYTVTAYGSPNTAGFVTFASALVVAPAPTLTSTTSLWNVYQELEQTIPLTINYVGVPTYSVTPALPLGFSIVGNTITGTLDNSVSSGITTVHAISITNPPPRVTIAPWSLTTVTNGPLSVTYPNRPSSLGLGITATFTPTTNFSFSASGSTFAMSNLPTGLSYDASTGVITGTVSGVTGSGTATITVHGLPDNPSQDLLLPSWNWTVTATPTVVYSTFPTLLVGTVLPSQTPSCNFAVVNMTWTTDPPLPPGLVINSSTGVVSGTPTEVAASTVYTVTVTTEFEAVQATTSLTLQVWPLPTLSYPTWPLAAYVGDAVSALPEWSALPSYVGLTFAVSSGALPSGVTLTADGILTGILTTVGTSTFRIQGANATDGWTALSPTYECVVTEAPYLRYLWSGPCILDQVFGPYAPVLNFVPSGFSVVPTLPQGLSLDPTTGACGGVPTVLSGETVYRFTATGLGLPGGSVSWDGTLSVEASGSNPLENLSYPALTVAMVNQAVTVAPNGNYPNTTFVLMGDLLSGLTWDPATGVLSGVVTTPASPLTYLVTATQGPYLVDTAFEFRVDLPFQYTVVSATTLPQEDGFTVLRVGQYVEFVPQLTEAERLNVVDYSVDPPLPEGLILDAATGVIRGRPTQSHAQGLYRVSARLVQGYYASDVLALVVNDIGYTGVVRPLLTVLVVALWVVLLALWLPLKWGWAWLCLGIGLLLLLWLALPDWGPYDVALVSTVSRLPATQSITHRLGTTHLVAVAEVPTQAMVYRGAPPGLPPWVTVDAKTGVVKEGQPWGPPRDLGTQGIVSTLPDGRRVMTLLTL